MPIRSTFIGLMFSLAAMCAGADVSSHHIEANRVAPKSPFELAYFDATPFAKTVGRAADAALDSSSAGNFTDAATSADNALMLAARYGTAIDANAFREAAFTRRLVHQIEEAPEASRNDLLAYLRAHKELAHLLVFAITDKDNLPGVYGLLDRLRLERPKQLAEFPELATALCIVRDHDLTQHINENPVTAADPLAVFDYFVAHEKHLYYGLHGVPVELLCYLVDTTASIADLNWAIGKYAGTRDVGSLFFSIAYDFDYLDGKADKKLDKAPGGFNLPNILKYGGVCVDQAYFAVSIGKAIGVPSTMVGGASGEAGHAWVGYLKSVGKSAQWDFDSGRYEAFQGLRGNVTDPQTGDTVADSTVSLLGDLIGTNARQRQNAIAFVDAAKLLGAADEKVTPPEYPPELLIVKQPSKRPPPKAPAPRPASPAGQLDLIELGLRQFVAYPAGWQTVADLAGAGKLSEAQKQKWAESVQRLCGQTHPDFALLILEPMIETVDEPHEQSALWDVAFRTVRNRPDLAAEVKFHQARLWEHHHDLTRAGQCYTEVVDNYINAGPFALQALRGAESLLHQLGKDDRLLTLYATAAKAVTKPDLSTKSGFIHSSNWYKIREAYAAQLSDAGRTQEAEQIRAEDR